MPTVVALRPAIIAAQALTTVIFLSGSLSLYFTAKKELDHLVDSQHQADDRCRDRAELLLDENFKQAQDSVDQQLDVTTLVDLLLFSDTMNKTFNSVLLDLDTFGNAFVSRLQKQTLDDTPDVSGATSVVRTGHRRNFGRTSGMGVSMQGDDGDGWIVITYCWFDTVPPDDVFYRGRAKTYRELLDPETVKYISYEELDAGTGEWHYSFDEEGGYDIPNGTEVWSAPNVWLTDYGNLAFFMAVSTSIMPALPEDHFFYGKPLLFEADTDLGHWSTVIAKFIADRKPAGVFAVLDFEQSLVFAHTTETVPNKANDPSCRTSLDTELMYINNSCFTSFSDYSPTLEAVGNVLRNESSGVLLRRQVCACNRTMGEVNGGKCDNCTEMYVRWTELFKTATFAMSAVWYQPAHELRGELDLIEQEQAAKITEARVEAEKHAKQAEDSALTAVANALIAMVLSVAAGFFTSLFLGLMWYVVIAAPLSGLRICVALLGDMRVDDSIAANDSIPAHCVEAREVQCIRRDVMRAAARLKEYKSYLPQSVYRDDEMEEEEEEQHVGGGSARVSLQHTTSFKRAATDLSFFSKGSSVASGDSAAAPRSIKKEPVDKRVSLVLVNIIKFCNFIEGKSARTISGVIAEEVSKWCELVQSRRGTVDMVSGDKRLAGFNVTRGCGTHTQGAIHVLHECGPQGVHTGAAVSGRALCGDFGSESMMRSMVLGKVAAFVYTLERLAAVRGVRLLEQSVFQDVAMLWEARMWGVVSYRRFADKPLRLYEPVAPRNAGADANEEWMYLIGNPEETPVDNHNKDLWSRIESAIASSSSLNVDDTEDAPPSTACFWSLSPVGLQELPCPLPHKAP
eukprot:Hpha_TRINITY_DN15415_c2_g3::TRINITY_DN15415_c2_g3_i1::g.175500::m.175500